VGKKWERSPWWTSTKGFFHRYFAKLWGKKYTVFALQFIGCNDFFLLSPPPPPYTLSRDLSHPLDPLGKELQVKDPPPGKPIQWQPKKRCLVAIRVLDDLPLVAVER